MFEFEKIKVKLILAAVAFVLVAVGLVAWKSMEHKVATLQETVITQKVAATAMTQTIEHQVSAEKVTDAIQTAVALDANTIVAVHSNITQRSEQKVKGIEQKFDALPTNAVNTKARDDQTSAAMIDGLWESYCAGMPQDASCTKSA